MHITLIGNQNDIYIDPLSRQAYIDYTKAVNYKEVDMCGVNNLIIERSYEDSNYYKIIQASGYTMDRGLFVDLY